MSQGSAHKNSVIDLVAYRSEKRAHQNSAAAESDPDVHRVIEEIAHHLLMAVRVIRAYHRNQH